MKTAISHKIDIEKIKSEIVERLKPLNPNKIILFGSYAYGVPNKESDIDLFLLKDDLEIKDLRGYEREATKNIMDLIFKYKMGFDILSAPTKYIENREDYFYKVDILQNGIVLYEQNSN
jgi:predicted nucleotidyltransferase